MAKWIPGFLMLAAAVAVFAEEDTWPPVPIGVWTPHEVVLDGELNVKVSARNFTDEKMAVSGGFSYDGDMLTIAGDWHLTLEEVRGRGAITRKSFHGSHAEEAGTTEIAPWETKSWSLMMPVRYLVSECGTYRFRLKMAEHEKVGEPFEVVKEGVLPEGISLGYEPEKTDYFIGEPIFVRFTLKNDGAEEFHFEGGGDTRVVGGHGRKTRYAFTAHSDDGARAVDPFPYPILMGGWGAPGPVKPGDAYELELQLLWYLKFPVPGTYTVRCYQSLGFGSPKITIEEAGFYEDYTYGGSFEIELRLPTEQEMGDLLRSLLQERHIYKNTGDFAALHHECYLKPLFEMAREDRPPRRLEGLIKGIGSIQTVEATRCLIELARDERDAVKSAALWHLSARLPYVMHEGEIEDDSIEFKHTGIYMRRIVSEKCWDPALRPALVQIASEGLGSDSLDVVAASANCLGDLGEMDALPLLIAAADRLAPSELLYRERKTYIGTIAVAAGQLARLGAKPCKLGENPSPGRVAIRERMIHTRDYYRIGE